MRDPFCFFLLALLALAKNIIGRPAFASRVFVYFGVGD